MAMKAIDRAPGTALVIAPSNPLAQIAPIVDAAAQHHVFADYQCQHITQTLHRQRAAVL